MSHPTWKTFDKPATCRPAGGSQFEPIDCWQFTELVLDFSSMLELPSLTTMRRTVTIWLDSRCRTYQASGLKLRLVKGSMERHNGSCVTWRLRPLSVATERYCDREGLDEGPLRPTPSRDLIPPSVRTASRQSYALGNSLQCTCPPHRRSLPVCHRNRAFSKWSNQPQATVPGYRRRGAGWLRHEV